MAAGTCAQADIQGVFAQAVPLFQQHQFTLLQIAQFGLVVCGQRVAVRHRQAKGLAKQIDLNKLMGRYRQGEDQQIQFGIA